MNEKIITTLEDIAKLTPDEFERFLPDLLEWYKLKQHYPSPLTPPHLHWVDDGKVGLKEFRVRCGDAEATVYTRGD